MPLSGPPPDLSLVIEVFERIPHCRELGMKVIDLRPGIGFMQLDCDPRLVGNPATGVVHGGVITTLMDSLCGLVVMGSVPENTPIATLDLRIDYLQPATPERTLRASAECYKVTSSVAFVRGLAYHDTTREPIAHCTGTFMLGGTGLSGSRSKAGDDRPKGGQPC